MQERITHLFNNYISGKLTEEERQELITLLENGTAIAPLEELLQQQLDSYNDTVYDQLPVTENRIVQGILQKIQTASPAPRTRSVRRLPPVRKWAWAAVAMLLISIGTYWWFSHSMRQPMVAINNTHQPNDIAPGKDKAILTLSNGTTIVLDSAANGAIALQGNTEVVKHVNGAIEYHTKGAATDSMLTNTLRTPRGGQYHLTLPDGTQVWLNAASSITYPIAFTGKERKVTITGEAYFEVARLPLTPSGGGGKKIPFIVDIVSPAGAGRIEVLGTHFNINSYANEDAVKTTLLEGSVKVSNAFLTSNVILRPGQQAQTNPHQLRVIDNADIDKVMAWKNGLFNFENVGLEEVMRQIERWYDVTVVYEKGVPDIRFEGEISRNITLSELLKVLARADVKFKIEEGRRLVVLP